MALCVRIRDRTVCKFRIHVSTSHAIKIINATYLNVKGSFFLTQPILLISLVHSSMFFLDNIKIKEKNIGKKKKKRMKLLEQTESNADFFEDAPPADLNASFYHMNLSRPLLKVCM